MKKDMWLRLCTVNLAIVALLGFALRSKIVFPMPWLDYRNVLNAHSHFAFGGWVTLCIMVLLVYHLLPAQVASRRIYQTLFWCIYLTALGMALSFPFGGYYSVSISFSTLFIFSTYAFGFVYIKDLLKTTHLPAVKILAVTSLISLVLSSAGPFTLAYVLITKSSDSILYRHAIYSFLHFNYNGFFTLGVFAVFLNKVAAKAMVMTTSMKRFALWLSISVLPSLFLSLLWHNTPVYYLIGGMGAVFILIALFYFFKMIRQLNLRHLISLPLARTLVFLSLASFALKMLMNVGTLMPSLGNAVYGDRPVIIGFLHLVFLAFVSFYLIAELVEHGYFNSEGKTIAFPMQVFGFGVLMTESLLMLQGVGILFRVTSDLYSWLLWLAAAILLLGATMMSIVVCKNKNSHRVDYGYPGKANS